MAFVNQVVSKVQVINMDKDTDRLRRFDEQARVQGIHYERFPAIVGKDLAESPLLTPFCNEFCTDGMKGCAASHKTLWNRAAEEGHEYIMICEDDVILDPQFNLRLQKFWQQVPKDFDILMLGCGFFCGDTHAIPDTFNTLTGLSPEEAHENLLKIKSVIGAQGQIISRRCAEKVLQQPVTTHFDLQMAFWIHEHGLKAQSFNPPLVRCNDEETDSNLSDRFPPVQTHLFKKVQISSTMPLPWSSTENFAKVFGMNVNPLISILILAMIFIPSRFSVQIFAWLLLELMVSRDFKNTLRQVSFLLPFFLLRFIAERPKLLRQFLH